MTVRAEIDSGRRLTISVIVSLIAAVLVYFVFVLPAEFGRDPTGLGELMGLKGMSGFEVQSLITESQPPTQDQVEFPLAPFESVEYKYEMEAGQGLVYDWSASGEVLFDLHSEEQGTDPEDAISFSVGRGTQEQGTYVAPFAGKHGWFWENRGSSEVVVRLTTTGFASASITYSPQGEFRRPLSQVASD